jgi:DNA-binding transcriptional LysR family regulator
MAHMNTTLDQWEAFWAVVQLGGFARAAAHLNRTQSTISYAVAHLQEQIGVRVFELAGRKAQLTESGRALLADVEPLLTGFKLLEDRARALASGGEAEICLAVDMAYPNERLFSALAAFENLYPHVRLKLLQEAFISPTEVFASHGAHLCIAPERVSHEYFSQPIMNVRLAAVARADHPLLQMPHPLTRADLIRHLAVMLVSTEGPTPQTQRRPHSQRYLPVKTVESWIDAVRSGLCFGWLPVYRIQPYLSSGELVRLPLAVGGQRNVPLYLVHADIHSAGQEKIALANLLGANRKLEVI